MSNNPSMRFIDTETASVKMTGGVPFNFNDVDEHSGSDFDSEDDEVLSEDDGLRCKSGLMTSDNITEPQLYLANGIDQDPMSQEQMFSKSNESKENRAPEQNISYISRDLECCSKENEIDLDLDDVGKSKCFTRGNFQPVNSVSNVHSKSDASPGNSPSSSYRPIVQLSKHSDLFNHGAPQDIPSHMIINSDESYRHTSSRFNPFNQIPMIDEDHFSDTYFNAANASFGSSSPRSSLQNVGRVALADANKSDVTFAELGLAEDHFSHPQGHFGLSGVEELELAIDNCKDMIWEAEQGSEKQKNLVLKLVQLRIKLQEIKDGPEPVADDVKIILSHKMIPKSSRTSKYYCERCTGVIWGMLQYWYRCSECGYRCHEKCLQQILRTCAKAKVMENQPLIMEICPKETNDLSSQNYRCAECRSAISFKTGQSEPRLCDYSGRYYCEYCHWNDSVIIPARVLHNWDFSPRKVSRSSKQFLKLMQQKAVIRIQDINPMLFVYVDQLNEIKKLREEMMVMKKYITKCPSAMAAKLLLLLEKRQHFVESSDRYCMQDLLDSEEVLLPELVNVHSTWAQHIKVDCQLCQGRGFCCELCTDDDILFPFDNIAVVCAKCSNVLHRHCFAKKSVCPRCERRERKSAPQ